MTVFREVSSKANPHSNVVYTHISSSNLSVLKYSSASGLRTSVISVPRPRTFPRGSGKTSNELSSAEEVKTYCWGFGFFSDFAAIEATRT